MKTFKELTREELYDLHITQDLSYDQIGKIYNVPKYTVKYNIKKHNIIKNHNVNKSQEKIELEQNIHNDILNNMPTVDICKKYDINRSYLNKQKARLGLYTKYKDELTEYYINQKLSFKETAAKLNISEAEVINYCNWYQLVRGNDKIKKPITKEQLYHEYVVLNRNREDIYKEYGYTRFELNNLLKEYNITRPNHNKKQYPTKEELYDDYITKGMSINMLCEKYSFSKKLIHKLLTEYDIHKDINTIVADTKKTNMLKYGCPNPMQDNIIKGKVMSTNIVKYGSGCPLKNLDIRLKAQLTHIENKGMSDIQKTEYLKLNKVLTEGSSNDLREYFNNNFKDMTIYEIHLLTGYSIDRIQNIISDYDFRDIIKLDINTSLGEREVLDYIKSLGVNNIIERDRSVLSGSELDIYLPEYNIAIEFNGTWWHSNAHKKNNYHYKKSLKCEEAGIRLIHIYEYEWDNIITQEKIKSMLKIALGKTDTKIYARQCEIREISNNEAKPFNNSNHLQSHRHAKITYGLFYKNELVQLMSFSKHKNYEWEIIRGCPASNNIVVGGVSKLFKHFIKKHNPSQIFSYCDFNKFDGHGYESLGMKFIGYTGPNMSWIIGNNVINRSPSKHKELKELASGQIWGAGSKKYLWTKE